MTIHIRDVPHEVRHAEYVRVLRAKLPEDAFRANPRACAKIAVHVGIVIAGYFAFRSTTSSWWPLIALAVGISMGSLSFLAHDLSHRSIVRQRYLLYPTELVVWSLLFMPVTLWHRLHNAHHVHANGDGDPERRFVTSERSLPAIITAATLFPNKRLPYNLFCLLYFFFYPARQLAAAFGTDKANPSFVQSNPRFSRRDKINILLELLFIVALQGAIAILVRGAYPWATIAPAAIASVAVSWYFFTNHSLNPVDNGDDILAATTSVSVPGICNVLHSNFSYHAEHHLFPAMNSKYYPMVSALLKSEFPDRYHRVPMGEAWSTLWRSPLLASRRVQKSG